MKKITPFLWFDGKAEEAANFYTATFPNSKIVSMTRSGEAGPGPKGSVMSATFELQGQEFIALNGGPMFNFSPAISFFVHCENAGRGRSLLGKAFRGRGKTEMRLAERQIRRVVAGRADRPGSIAARQGCREIEASYERHAANGQARHRKSEESKRADNIIIRARNSINKEKDMNALSGGREPGLKQEIAQFWRVNHSTTFPCLRRPPLLVAR